MLAHYKQDVITSARALRRQIRRDMWPKAAVVSCVLCAAGALYSSFYAPLWDRAALRYRVEARFDPRAGRAAAPLYRRRHGTRGELLIASIGDGAGPPSDRYNPDEIYGDVRLYYTYPGHNNGIK